MRYSFEQPIWLLLLLLVPFVLALAWRRLRTLAPWRRRTALLIRALVLAAMVLALARPVELRPDDSLSVAFVVDGY